MKKEVIVTTPHYQNIKGMPLPATDFARETGNEIVPYRDEAWLADAGLADNTQQTYYCDAQKNSGVAEHAIDTERVGVAPCWENPKPNFFAAKKIKGDWCLTYREQPLYFPQDRMDAEISATLSQSLARNKDFRIPLEEKDPNLQWVGVYPIAGQEQSAQCYIYGQQLVANAPDQAGADRWYAVKRIQLDGKSDDALQATKKLFNSSYESLDQYLNRDFFLSVFMSADYNRLLAEKQAEQTAAHHFFDQGREQ